MVITHYEVVIIGGGIIGQSILYAIQNDTASAALVDDIDSLKATHAAGGMLGAQNEFMEDNPLFHLSLEGRAMMKEFSEELMSKGYDINYRQKGLLKIASEKDSDMLLKQYKFLKQYEDNVQWIKQQQMSRFAKGQLANVEEALWIPMDAQVHTTKYFEALKQLNKAPVYKEKVISIAHEKHYTITMEKQSITCERLVIAAGANTGSLLQQLNKQLTVQGIKGEVITLLHEGLQLEETVFQTNGHYIVPKKDHQYIIGATTSNERIKGNTVNGIHWLLDETKRILPALGNAKIVGINTGFRPATIHHQPVIDQIEENLFVASGHYRNGILLSRITGLLMRHFLYEQDHPLKQKYGEKFKCGG